MRYLTVNKCPDHGVMSIALDDEKGTGVRFTKEKCCGKWLETHRFPMRPQDLRDMARECECEAESDEKEGSAR